MQPLLLQVVCDLFSFFFFIWEVALEIIMRKASRGLLNRQYWCMRDFIYLFLLYILFFYLFIIYIFILLYWNISLSVTKVTEITSCSIGVVCCKWDAFSMTSGIYADFTGSGLEMLCLLTQLANKLFSDSR